MASHGNPDPSTLEDGSQSLEDVIKSNNRVFALPATMLQHVELTEDELREAAQQAMGTYRVAGVITPAMVARRMSRDEFKAYCIRHLGVNDVEADFRDLVFFYLAALWCNTEPLWFRACMKQLSIPASSEAEFTLQMSTRHANLPELQRQIMQAVNEGFAAVLQFEAAWQKYFAASRNPLQGW